MKKEISAGGIVVRNTGGEWEVLVLQDMNDAWTFPKGKIDAGEKPEQAARREIREEVGLTTLATVTRLPAIHYIYKKNGPISKTVRYYVFESQADEALINQENEGIHNASWMPIERAIEIIGYPETNKPLLRKTKQWILHPRLT